MAEAIRSPQPNIDRIKLEGVIRDVIFDALFICDIENDKIPNELKTKLNHCVESLLPDAPDLTRVVTAPITDKLSITGEDMETLHTRVMAAVKDRLAVMGVTDSQKLEELGDVVFQIIQNEKVHRDAEMKAG